MGGNRKYQYTSKERDLWWNWSGNGQHLHLRKIFVFHLHFERFPTSSAWGNKKGRESRSRRELAKDIHRNENELYRVLGYTSGQNSCSLEVN